MIKILLPFALIFLSININGVGQKFTNVTIVSTTNIREALHICKIAGETEGFFSIDFDKMVDSFSTCRYYGTAKIIIEIKASPNNSKNSLQLKISHIKMFGGYKNILESFVKKLDGKLENIEVGQYFVSNE